MRPGQNKRMRGRNNNNSGSRKGPNPLTRSYESNGPDVKIRGTAHHVAEKYLQLARDAQSSGDPVMAESYLQHAEHYFRLIAAAQQAQQQASLGLTRPVGELDTDDGDDDDDFGGLPDRFASPVERFPPPPPPPPPLPQNGNGQGVPQPYGGERPFYNNGGERQNYDRPDRGPRPDRPPYNNDRNAQRDDRGPRPPRPQREFRPDGGRSEQRQPAALQPPSEQPALESRETPLSAFITAPVRVAEREPAAGPGARRADVGRRLQRRPGRWRRRRRRVPSAAAPPPAPSPRGSRGRAERSSDDGSCGLTLRRAVRRLPSWRAKRGNWRPHDRRGRGLGVASRRSQRRRCENDRAGWTNG